MSYTIYVQMKKPGRQKHADIQPVPVVLDEKPRTVRDLLVGLTKLGVRQYNARKDEGQILAYLTREEIEAQAERGKVSFGLRGGADAAEDSAVANTLQCFEDGIYRIFMDGQPLEALEDTVEITEENVFTFVRLTMLAGRMW